MWIIYTLVAVILWSVVNFADGYLVEKNKKIGHPIGSLVIFSSLFALITAAIIYAFFHAVVALTLAQVGVLLIAGFLNLGWIIFYLYALKDEEVSRVIPWFLSVPLFGYILGYVVLGESLAGSKLLGGLVILIGGLVLTIQLSTGKRRFKIKWKPAVLMTIASLLIAGWGVAFKFVARDAGFWVSSFWEHIGLAVAGIVALIFVRDYRSGFFFMLKKSGTTILLVNCGAEILTIVANLFSNFAILMVPVALVYFVQVSQPSIVFILGVVCTIYLPHIAKEDISRRNVLQKVVGIAIMTIGGVLLLI